MNRRSKSWAVAALCVAAVAGYAGGACTSSSDSGGGKPGQVTKLTDPEDAIDQDLMLSLSLAKNFHHKAKVYMTDGKLAEATEAVRQILSIPFPAKAPEAEDVRIDARALLAKLLVGQGQVDAAMSVVDEGLASATRESFFVANLYTVKAEVLQAQAAALAGDGSTPPSAADQARAAEIRKQAIVALDKSIAIDKVLQKQRMEDQ